MTNKQLQEELRKYDDDVEILIPEKVKGNDWKPVDFVEEWISEGKIHIWSE